jgi:peptidoglycan/LPS O-acetylase OafA/YrhL
MTLEDGIKIRSTNINLLRFICAALVIISHSSAVAEGKIDLLSTWLGGQCNIGGAAVAVFFFLSGLYVAKSISNSSGIREYFIKRCRRIFPQLWIVVLVSAFILGPIVTTLSPAKYFRSSETYKYLFNMLLLPVHNLPGVFSGHPDSTVNGPLWTMPVEFLCYIILALIFFALKRKNTEKNSRAYLAITILSYVFYLYLSVVLKNDFLISIGRPIICFFVGMTAYEYRKKIRLHPISGIVLLVALFLLKLDPLFNAFMVFIIPYAVVSIGLGLPQLPVKNRVFNCSYEMYLLGWPIQQLVIEKLGRMSAVENWLIAIPIDIIVGYLLYELTEKILKKLPK